MIKKSGLEIQNFSREAGRRAGKHHGGDGNLFFSSH